MKTRLFISVALCVAMLALGTAQAQDIDALKKNIRNCNDAACKQAMQAEADRIYGEVSENFNEDFVSIGNRILINNCKSIIREIIYQLQTLEPYYRFERKFYLAKLEALKDCRQKLDSGKTGQNDFERCKRQAQAQYHTDCQHAQLMVNEKALRIGELCTQLKSNVEDIRKSQGYQDNPLSPQVKNTVLELKKDPVWQAFYTQDERGKRIRGSLAQASSVNVDEEVVPCLMGMFSWFEADGAGNGGVVFKPSIINALKKRYVSH